MNEILQYLKKNGQKLDMTRYDNEKILENISCRISGYIPPAAPGRKSKAQLSVKAEAEAAKN
jgi:hypothetical protein